MLLSPRLVMALVILVLALVAQLVLIGLVRKT
jgi:hypothetical protein